MNQRGKKKTKETREKNRQEGESNRQQTIYRALNYFISTVQPFDLGENFDVRLLLDTKYLEN